MARENRVFACRPVWPDNPAKKLAKCTQIISAMQCWKASSQSMNSFYYKELQC